MSFKITLVTSLDAFNPKGIYIVEKQYSEYIANFVGTVVYDGWAYSVRSATDEIVNCSFEWEDFVMINSYDGFNLWLLGYNKQEVSTNEEPKE